MNMYPEYYFPGPLTLNIKVCTTCHKIIQAEQY